MPMAKLTKTEVLHVAKLSDLNLTEPQVKKFLPQLSRIVEYVSKLSEVDTKGVEVTSQTTDFSNVYRKDVVNFSNQLTQDKALSGSKSVDNGLFKVEAILEGRTDK